MSSSNVIAVETADEWRRRADAVAQLVRFSLDRSYLAASAAELRKHLRFVEDRSGQGLLHPPAWLKLERIGIPGPDGVDPSIAMRVALSSLHRPDARMLYLVVGEAEGYSVYLGVCSLEGAISSFDLVTPAKAFIETSWPATRLTPCAAGQGPREDLAATLKGLHGRYAMTGVPTLIPAAGHRSQSFDLLLDGMAGRRFAYLVIADPLPIRHQTAIVSAARDLIGSLETLASMTVTRSATSSSSESTGTDRTTTEGHTHGASATRTHSFHDTVELVGALGLLLTPLGGVVGLAGGMAALASLLTPGDRSYAHGRSSSVSGSTAERISKSVTRGEALGESLAEHYVSAHVEALVSQLRRLVERVEGQSVWEVGAYLFADEQEGAPDAIGQLTALLNGARSAREEPIRFQDIGPFWNNQAARDLSACRRPRVELMSEGGARLEHPLGRTFGGLSTPLNSEELSLLVGFPRREVAGIKARPVASFSLNPSCAGPEALSVGQVLRGDEPTGKTMRVALDSLVKNVLVTGSIGSGKSTTSRHLLIQLHARGLPFLVIEPAKTEYVEWARRLNESLAPDDPRRVRVFMPGATGRPGVEPLHLNPFHVVSRDDVVSHIERLKALLTASFPMQEALPLLLESVLYGLYAKNNWLGEASGNASPTMPTISQLLRTRTSAEEAGRRPPRLLDEIIRLKGYDEKVTQNFTAALETRFECLRMGWKREVFDCSSSTAMETLFERPVVVNLSRLADDRALAAGLLLTFLHEWRQQQAEVAQSDTGTRLRHLLVLEEAHCLLEPVRHVAAESMDPKGMLSQMFAEFMSEMRAWGQGFMLVDQYPTRLIVDAVKNTNLKIVHRLPARDDQEVAAAAMSLDLTQARLIPHLLPGQAIVMGADDDAPLLVQVTCTEYGP